MPLKVVEATIIVPTGVNPAADILPMMNDVELAELAIDIQANGQLVPIQIDEQGRVLDGRNRKLVLERLGIKPRTETVKNIADPIAYVVSLNVKRRNLSASQKAMAAAEAWELAETEGRTLQSGETAAATMGELRQFLPKAAE